MSDVALVSGGTRGIGAAVARALAAEGRRVAVTYHGDEAAAVRFKQEAGIPVYRWDVADESACRAGIEQVEADLGPVSILVNNAGITRDGMFHRMTWDQWRAVLSTNLDSMFAMTRVVIEGMRERRFGRIVNISSINGQKGQVGQTNYSAAKAGVIGFTKALALENASRGVTVNAVCPGYLSTDMTRDQLARMVATTGRPQQEVLEALLHGTPQKRLIDADEVAAAVLFLCTEGARGITGESLVIDGGELRR